MLLFLKKVIRDNAVCIPVIAVGEFLSKASAEEKAAFEKLVSMFPVYSIEEEDARFAATYRARFLQTSRVRLVDSLLAAQANRHEFTLVTNNDDDFPMDDIAVVFPGDVV